MDRIDALQVCLYRAIAGYQRDELGDFMFDEIDLKLLYLLKRDARMSLTKMGKELSLSVPAITYRLNRLINKKVITNFTINIDEKILTPNYVSYVVKGRIEKNFERTLDDLHNLRLFEHLIRVATFENFIGITRNLSSRDINQLINFFESSKISDYKLETITFKQNDVYTNDIVVEEANSIYCPLCQKQLDGTALITTIGTQIMGFCCENCKVEFTKSYNDILQLET